MATYFVKSGGGTGDGLSYANAWDPLYYKNTKAVTMVSGDIVQFDGGLYPFSFPQNSGVIHKKYTGSVTKPLFSGLETLTGFTNEGNGVYSKVLGTVVTRLNIVKVDTAYKEMGRYPRHGVIPYTSHSGSPQATSLSSTGLGTAVNFVGGEVVIRKVQWVWDRHEITSQTSTTVGIQAGDTTTTGNGHYQPFTPQPGTPGNGFFVQHHLNTLTVFAGHQPEVGDWFFYAPLNKLYMYFGASDNPTNHTIKVAVLDNIADFVSKSNIEFEDIDFEGVNKNHINFESATGCRVERCKFIGAGHHGMSGTGLNLPGGSNTGNTIVDNEFDYCLNQGIRFSFGADNNIVNGNSATNISPWPGHTFPADFGGDAIEVIGDGNTIKWNFVAHIGYNGITWNGSNNIVDENYGLDCCAIKDDGAVIYSFNGVGGPTNSGNFVRKNLLIGSNGALLGKEGYGDLYGSAPALYFDDGCNGFTASGNVCWGSTYAGIYAHNIHDAAIQNNKTYDNNRGMYWQQNHTAGVRNVTHTGNDYVAKTSSQIPMEVRSSVAESDLGLFWGTTSGSSNNNRYCRPITNDGAIIYVFISGATDTLMTLATFQSTYNRDAASSGSPFSISDLSDFRFEYNEDTANTKQVSLGGTIYEDMAGASYTGNITLQPMTALVLLNTGIAQLKALKAGGKFFIGAGGKLLVRSQ
jgi:hypothetical protein